MHKIIVGETTFLEHDGETIYVLLGDTMANVDAYLVVLPVGNVLQQVLDVIGFLSPCNVFVLLVVKGLLYALALKDADAERGVFGREVCRLGVWSTEGSHFPECRQVSQRVW